MIAAGGTREFLLVAMRCAPPRRDSRYDTHASADTLVGLAVHIASRISGRAEPGEILVSRTVRDLAIGAPIQFAERGTHTLRGVPEAWQLYAVDA